jgi:hypothetical protein
LDRFGRTLGVVRDASWSADIPVGPAATAPSESMSLVQAERGFYAASLLNNSAG